MKRIFEFVLQAFGIPIVYGTFIFIVCVLALISFLLACDGCYSDSGEWIYNKEGDYGPVGWHSELKPSADTPESLKPYFDPGLTEALNR